jgi:hypothetical protein
MKGMKSRETAGLCKSIMEHEASNFICCSWYFNLEGQNFICIYRNGVGLVNALTLFIVLILLIPYNFKGFIYLKFRWELAVNAVNERLAAARSVVGSFSFLASLIKKTYPISKILCHI